jgi:phosphate transport system ATP-binding protein
MREGTETMTASDERSGTSEEATKVGSANKEADENLVIQVRDLDLFYGDFQALHGITMDIPANTATAIIGPSGCGKSTYLRCLNRMNDLMGDTTVRGEVLLDGVNIYGPDVEPVRLRRYVGMVFQAPNPFPKTIFDNVAYGPRMHGERRRERLVEVVEQSLKRAALWEEVKDRLNMNALSLSGGQQQRLCIARAIAVEPEVLLMDEPASSLDPVATNKIEDLIHSLKKRYTVIIVTHNMQQAGRVGDTTAFFLNGKLVEYGETGMLFSDPEKQETEDYISGRFG